MARQTEDTAPVRPPDIRELFGTALPTADEGGTVGGFTGLTREDVLAQMPQFPTPGPLPTTPLNAVGEFVGNTLWDIVKEGPLFGDLLGFGERGQKNRRINELPEDERRAAMLADLLERGKSFTESGPTTTAAGGIKKVGQGVAKNITAPFKSLAGVEPLPQRGIREAADLLGTTTDDAARRLTPPTGLADDVALPPPPARLKGSRPPDDEIGKLQTEAESEFIAQRRGVRSHEQSQEAADAILRAGLNADEVVALGKSGVAVNAEHLLAANKIADDASEAFVKAVDSADGDPLNALVQALKVQRAVRGFVAEGARVTEANKLIKDEIAERVVKDPSTSRQLIAAMRGLDDPENLNVAVQMAKGMDLKNKDEIRRFLQVILDMGEAEQKSRVKPQTFGDQVISALNLPKTIMASMDLSAPFRQGLIQSISHPGIAARSAVAMVQAAKSPQFAKQVMREIQSSEFAPLRKKAGLYFSDFEGGAALKDREEAFMSNVAVRFPGISGSNRAYAIYLNKLRADIFDQVARAWGPAKGDAEYKALAQFLNWSTGRGDLGPLNSSAPLLNAAFFAPRLVVSRVETAVAPLLFAAQGNTAAAKVAATDLVKFVGAGLSVLAVSQLGGAKVESDPRSSKFGKIEIGPHQIDIWGGFQPVARYMAQFITGERKTMGGDIIVMDGSGPFGDSRWTTADRFARSKLSPPASFARDFLEGEDFLGNPVDPLSAALSRFVPLGWQQIHGAVEADKQDAIRGAIVGTLGLVGLGTVSIDNGADQPFIQNPFNTRTEVEIEKARLERDAPTVEGVKLGADEQRRYQTVVEESRNAALGNLLNDPAYIAANNTQKKDLWQKTSDRAADAGRKAFGIELAATGKNQEEITAGLRLAVNNTSGNYEKAMSLSVIAQEGVISPEVKALYDSQRKSGELGVDEFLHGKELVDAWSRAPAWTIGTPAAWTAAKQARDQYVTLIKGTTAAERAADPNIQRFYETEASGWLKTLYEAGGAKRDKYVHESRKTIALDKLWGKFSDAVTGLP